MRKHILSMVAVLLCCANVSPTMADIYDDMFDAAEFEGVFELCTEYPDTMDDDKQCICINRVIRQTLSTEDLQKISELEELGRVGSARKIYKKALSAAYKECF